MKNLKISLLAITALLCMLGSCSKDKAKDDGAIVPTPTGTLSATFEVYLDGTLYHKASNALVNFEVDQQDNELNTGTSVIDMDMGQTPVSLKMVQFPTEIGSVKNVVDALQPTDTKVSLVDLRDNKVYTMISGTLTRTSAKKLTFEGIATGLDGNEHAINGFAESDAWNLVE